MGYGDAFGIDTTFGHWAKSRLDDSGRESGHLEQQGSSYAEGFVKGSKQKEMEIRIGFGEGRTTLCSRMI